MPDIHIRRDGALGRITLTRPEALNALTHAMILAIDAALVGWAEDAKVAAVLIDASGDRAFCAGGDLIRLNETGQAGDYAYGQTFWRDEYRMNDRLHAYPKPVVSLLQGFTMGGGVGLGCHAAHRVVCDSSRISMPECAVGLVPDVGGSWLLARAPGHLGEYLGTTATRMGPGDAILAGFADVYIPQADWPDLIATLTETGDCAAIARAARPAPEGTLAALQPQIDAAFAGDTLGDIIATLTGDPSDFATQTLNRLSRPSPLAMACAVEIIHHLRGDKTLREALALEYRFAFRAMERGDFLEGIRAAIIDKDRSPHWVHPGPAQVPAEDVTAMLLPLGRSALRFDEPAT